MRTLASITFALICATSSSATAKGEIVAVFDVETSGVELTKPIRDRLSSYLMTKIASVGYRVVPRARLQKQLREQKRRSYKSCYDQSCQIEIGRELAAKKSLSTKILRLGRRCIVTMALYDLKRATSERAADVEGGCSVGGLVRSIESAAQKMAIAISAPRRRLGVLDRKHCPLKGTLRRGETPPKGLHVFCVDARGRRHGLTWRWHENHRLRAKERFRDGLQEGLTRRFHRTGEKQSETHHRAGKRHGKYIAWNRDGSVRERGQYRRGQKIGAWERLYAGRVKQRTSYKNDDREGWDIEFDQKGTKRQQVFYRAGVRDGPTTLYHSNGKKSEHGVYRAGKRVGMWTTHTDKGTLRTRGTYLGRKKHGKWEFYLHDGPLHEAGEFRMGVKHGAWQHYHNVGAHKLRAQGRYEHGKRVGPWTRYHSHGRVRARGNYVAGKQHGRWRYWGRHHSGKKRGQWGIQSETFYEHGKQIRTVRHD